MFQVRKMMFEECETPDPRNDKRKRVRIFTQEVEKVRASMRFSDYFGQDKLTNFFGDELESMELPAKQAPLLPVKDMFINAKKNLHANLSTIAYAMDESDNEIDDQDETEF